MLDTLAQIGTKEPGHGKTKPRLALRGKGSDLTNEKAIKNKARKKMITLALGKSLLEIAEDEGDQKMKKALWNTYYCQSYLTSSGWRSFGNYCKNRTCLVCSGNRKAELIRKYHHVIASWKNPQFVTLTVKAVRAKSLSKWMTGVLRAFDLIRSKLKKQAQRGTGIGLVGIKSLECNFNPKNGTYNPHLHLIVENENMAEVLVAEWLKKWTPKYTNSKAQKVISISDKEKALIEIIKYGTKIFTEPNPNNRGEGQRAIYTKALYNILQAMKGKRLFERFGFNQKLSVSKGDKHFVEEFERYGYDLSVNDWVNSKGKLLSGYFPTESLRQLLTNLNLTE